MSNNPNIKKGNKEGKQFTSENQPSLENKLAGKKKAKEKKIEQKRFQTIIDRIGNLVIQNPKVLKSLKDDFPNIEKELTADEMIVFRQYQKAIYKSDVNSAIFIRNTRGEKPVDKKAFTDLDGLKDRPIVVSSKEDGEILNKI